MRLNLHARMEIAAVAALLLGSCAGDGPSLTDKQRDEVSDVAADAAAEQVSDLESRVGAFGRDLDKLRDTMNGNVDASNANRDLWNENAKIVNRALDRLDRVEGRLGM